MVTFVLNNENEDHKPDRLQVVESALDLLKQKRNYDIVEGLGSGTYGDVVKMLDAEKQTYFAAKIVTNDMITEAESTLWKSLEHPNIVPLTEYVDLSPVKAVVYIMPIQETSLGARMSDREFKLKEEALEQVKEWLRQTLCGLEYLHNKDLVHLDVKEDNVLISHSNTATLCDFTCLNKADKPIRSAKVGSPVMYRPPEAFYRDDSIEGKPCDMWAFGIMTIEILTDFFLSKNLQQVDHNWLLDVHPTLHEILQEQIFKTYFDVTFTKVHKDGDKYANMALDFIYSFLKMEPSERATATESQQHSFLIGGPFVANEPDDIWNHELYKGATDFEEISLGSFNTSDFSSEGDSNEGSDCFNRTLDDFNTSENENSKTFETEIFSSRHSLVVTKMPSNSELEMWYHSPSEILTTNEGTGAENFSIVTKIQKMVNVISLSGPQVPNISNSIQNTKSKFTSEEYIMDIKYGFEDPVSDSETSQTQSKFFEDSETNLSLDSEKEYTAGLGIPLSEKIQNLRLRIKELIENFREIKEINSQKEYSINAKVTQVNFKSHTQGNYSECPSDDLFENSNRKSQAKTNDLVPVTKEVRNLRKRIKILAEISGIIEENTKKVCLKDKVSEFSARAVIGKAAEKLECSVLEAHTQSDLYYYKEDNQNHFSEGSHEDFNGGHGDHLKGSEEDFTTGFKPASLEATLESVVSRKSLSKHPEENENTNLQSFDVSSEERQEKSDRINLVGHNSAEVNVPVDSKSSTTLQTRERRKRFIGWIQSKFARAMMFCCPCMTKKNSLKDA